MSPHFENYFYLKGELYENIISIRNYIYLLWSMLVHLNFIHVTVTFTKNLFNPMVLMIAQLLKASIQFILIWMIEEHLYHYVRLFCIAHLVSV